MTTLLIALVLGLILTPAAIKLNILDKPNYRKIHTKPIPKAGGLGIFVPFLILMSYHIYSAGITAKTLSVVVITLILVIVGVIDDKVELKSTTKFIIQAVLAAATIYFGNVFSLTGIFIIDAIVTFVWIVGIINAINLIDGLDGLAAGIGGITCIGFLVLGYKFNSVFVIYTTIVLIGSICGFLRYNFRPAKIFMGDTGSLPLGYNLALLGIFSTNAIGGFRGLLFTAIILALPIFDTSLSMFRRYINGKPIFAPDRSHFYNLLMDVRGIEHVRVVLLLYLIDAVLEILSIIYLNIGFALGAAEFIILIAASVYAVKKLGFVKVDSTANN